MLRIASQLRHHLARILQFPQHLHRLNLPLALCSHPLLHLCVSHEHKHVVLLLICNGVHSRSYAIVPLVAQVLRQRLDRRSIGQNAGAKGDVAACVLVSAHDDCVAGERGEGLVERGVHLLGSAFEEATAPGDEEGVTGRGAGEGEVGGIRSDAATPRQWQHLATLRFVYSPSKDGPLDFSLRHTVPLVLEKKGNRVLRMAGRRIALDLDALPNLKRRAVLDELIHHRCVASSPDGRLGVGLCKVAIAARVVLVVVRGDAALDRGEASAGGGRLYLGQGEGVDEDARVGRGVYYDVCIIVVSDRNGDDLHCRAGGRTERRIVSTCLEQ